MNDTEDRPDWLSSARTLVAVWHPSSEVLRSKPDDLCRWTVDVLLRWFEDRGREVALAVPKVGEVVSGWPGSRRAAPLVPGGLEPVLHFLMRRQG